MTALACAGDRAAIDEVTRCYLSQLLSVGRWACGDETAAEDAVQEGLLRATEHLNEFRGEGSFDGWLRAIVINACARQRRRRSGLELADEQPNEHQVTPELAAFQGELRQELAAALADLPEQDRAAVVMTQLEGLSSAEVAERLAIAPATLRKRISRSRARLRDRLRNLESRA